MTQDELQPQYWFNDTLESRRILAEERARIASGDIWERCAGPCGQEYRFLYLCRKHMLCGNCHEGVPL